MRVHVAASVRQQTHVLICICPCSFPGNTEVVIWVVADDSNLEADRVFSPARLLLAEQQRDKYQMILVRNIRTQSVLAADCITPIIIGPYIDRFVNPSKLSKTRQVSSWVEPAWTAEVCQYMSHLVCHQFVAEVFWPIPCSQVVAHVGCCVAASDYTM